MASKIKNTAALFRAAYEASGKTSNKIAEESGAARSTVSSILYGVAPVVSLELCARIGDILNIPPYKIAAAWQEDKLIDIENRAKKRLEQEKNRVKNEITTYLENNKKTVKKSFTSPLIERTAKTR
jgi:transcriptional regulator with XRE-family HTH domain